MIDNYFCLFPFPVIDSELPDTFTFPFYYDPHPLCIKASSIIQKEILESPDFEPYFKNLKGEWILGKMIGVMIVKKIDGQIGFLTAFSGKLDERSDLHPFVRPVFNFIDRNSFYRQGEEVLNVMNREIEDIEASVAYQSALKKLHHLEKENEQKLLSERNKMKLLKKERDIIRKKQRAILDEDGFNQLKEKLKTESLGQQFIYKEYHHYLSLKKEVLTKEVDLYRIPLEQKRKERKALSQKLQKRLFESYKFLNANLKETNLTEIFKDTYYAIPPSGAGDCAAPKLLQFAYKNQLKPIAIAEFWWGKSPTQEIRKHGMFYPACRGKCEPILGHMLKGLEVDPNPLLENPAAGKDLPIIYEDDYIAIVNKPPNFLSVPGKNIEDSVWLRMRKKYPNATGPLITHRLDMSTSGILVISKSAEVYKPLQRQFMSREISKSYVAILDGITKESSGTIDLPLRGDFYDRPRQIVCHEHGKSSRTKWELIEYIKDTTKVRFYPITGRTHQLRIHAAHPEGLNLAIVGDDLYGQKADRLYLHAEEIKFTHPITGKQIHINAPAPF